MRAAAVVVIGVGNPVRGDDGLGPAVIDHLEAAGATGPGLGLVRTDGEPARMIEAWRGHHRAIVVDAIRLGAEPGTIHQLDATRDRLPGWSAGASSHRGGLAEAIALGRALGVIPPELLLVGAEPGDLTLGAPLSGAVRAAVPDLASRILHLAGAVPT